MSDLAATGAEVLYREALYLDTQRWDEWLALYLEDCEYWVPAWKSEHEPTSDPKRELSLVYYANRAGLEDRVWRVRSRKSPASLPLPRTQHTITNVLVEAPSEPGHLRLMSNWTVHQFLGKSKETEVLYGRSEHDLVQRDSVWRIARKKTLVLNDMLPPVLDFYNL
jgi:3-phenylpropionate/cinnamic acid dioxygenase small subunit